MNKRNSTYGFAIRFLRWFCPPHLLEEIEGDLLQRFERDIKNFGEKKARIRFVWNTIRFFRPGIIFRNKLSVPQKQSGMLNHYVKTAFRFANNHKGYFGINLIGMAVGLCVCFFAILYVNFELSYDSYHEKYNRIYRLVTDVETSVGTFHQSSSGLMASALQASFPEVEAATRVFLDYLIIQSDELSGMEETIAYTDSTIFSVFSFPLKQGDPKTDRKSVV